MPGVALEIARILQLCRPGLQVSLVLHLAERLLLLAGLLLPFPLPLLFLGKLLLLAQAARRLEGLGRGIPGVGGAGAVEDRSRRHVVLRSGRTVGILLRNDAVLVADGGGAEQLFAGGAVPVAVGGEDAEILLAGVLHRVAEHAGIDAIELAGVVAAGARQGLAQGRAAAGGRRIQGVEPVLLGRGVEIANRPELLRGNGAARVDGDETDPLGIRHADKGASGRGFHHVDALAVIAVPIGEVMPLVLVAAVDRAVAIDVHGGRAGRGADDDLLPERGLAGRGAGGGGGGIVGAVLLDGGITRGVPGGSRIGVAAGIACLGHLEGGGRGNHGNDVGAAVAAGLDVDHGDGIAHHEVVRRRGGEGGHTAGIARIVDGVAGAQHLFAIPLRRDQRRGAGILPVIRRLRGVDLAGGAVAVYRAVDERAETRAQVGGRTGAAQQGDAAIPPAGTGCVGGAASRGGPGRPGRPRIRGRPGFQALVGAEAVVIGGGECGRRAGVDVGAGAGLGHHITAGGVVIHQVALVVAKADAILAAAHRIRHEPPVHRAGIVEDEKDVGLDGRGGGAGQRIVGEIGQCAEAGAARQQRNEGRQETPAKTPGSGQEHGCSPVQYSMVWVNTTVLVGPSVRDVMRKYGCEVFDKAWEP